MTTASKKLVFLLAALAVLSLCSVKAESIESIPAVLNKLSGYTSPKCPTIDNPAIVINQISWTPKHIKKGETLEFTYNVDIYRDIEQPMINLDVVAMGFIPVSMTIDPCVYAAICPLKAGHYEGKQSVVVPDFPDPVPFSTHVTGDAKLVEKGSTTVIGCYNVDATVGKTIGDVMKAEF